MSSHDYLILGGGVAGLGAYYRLQQESMNAVIYEAKDELGGLLANFSINGFRFDNAVHFSFTEIPEVRQLFDKVDIYKHAPNAYCLDRGYWMKHPVQNNLYPLPTEEKLKLIKGFIERPDLVPENYAQWLDHQYGYEIAGTYPKKYTRKYWGIEAAMLSTTWVGNRMRRAEIDEILRGSLERRDDNHYYTNEMRYPKQGGYFEFIRELAESAEAELNKKAVKVDVVNKCVHFADGSVQGYQQLISSLPLPIICELIDDCPSEVREAAKSLLWTTVDLISIGFNKPDIPPYLWYYIYDDENLAARAYSPSWKSPNNAPEGKSSLQFEIYNLSNKERLQPEDLIINIKQRILSDKICEAEDILFTEHKHLPFGNVVFDLGMEARRKVILDYLESVGIKSCGRFGEWDYFWSDQSFMSGYNICETKS